MSDRTVAALIVRWQEARRSLRALEQAEHPDVTDALGRIWTWLDGDLYRHDDMALPLTSITDEAIRRPTQRALANPNYWWCSICRGMGTRARVSRAAAAIRAVGLSWPSPDQDYPLGSLQGEFRSALAAHAATPAGREDHRRQLDRRALDQQLRAEVSAAIEHAPTRGAPPQPTACDGCGGTVYAQVHQKRWMAATTRVKGGNLCQVCVKTAERSSREPPGAEAGRTRAAQSNQRATGTSHQCGAPATTAPSGRCTRKVGRDGERCWQHE